MALPDGRHAAKAGMALVGHHLACFSTSTYLAIAAAVGENNWR
jgi:hypothetical protein